ncbi:MFS transporter [Candidatus Nitrosotenuis chungbukensis]|uniref:MFS transporter n=1 Tax=Candidatus Nitrosotenuis chungbukensis TaxID=1353246 RepID=UPI002673976B|nr:MFS transporter [Candidatus Nitrosotenuis chungbukensis]WKT57295.1 MFS transporter [Candidatus Nitrosotenuis chungbukensis]
MESINKKWLGFILPINIAAEGLHTVIPLFVLSLGGGIGEVSVIIAIHYGAAALGSIFWGKILDKYHVKKAVLLVTFSMILICCLWLYYTTNIEPIYVISPLSGFFLTARGPVTQMLVMETSPNNQWGKFFARASILSTLGSLAAMLIGAVWSFYFDIRQYFMICAIATAISIAISLQISKTHFHIERNTLVQSIHGIQHIFSHFRMHNHFFFPKVPELYDFKHIIILFKGKISHEIGFLFLTNFLFYFGSNIYFTALTPFLKSFGLSDSTVFSLYLVHSGTMVGFFFLAPKIITRVGEERSTMMAYVPRVIGVLIAGFVVTLFIGSGLLAAAIASMCLMVVGFSIYSTSNSLLLFKAIPKGFEGTYLGVNGSMVGMGVFGGALTAGFVTKTFNYPATFLVSVLVLIGSAVLFRMYLHHKLSGRIL